MLGTLKGLGVPLAQFQSLAHLRNLQLCIFAHNYMTLQDITLMAYTLMSGVAKYADAKRLNPLSAKHLSCH